MTEPHMVPFDGLVDYGDGVTVQTLIDTLEAEVRDHRATRRELEEARSLIAAVEADRG